MKLSSFIVKIGTAALVLCACLCTGTVYGAQTEVICVSQDMIRACDNEGHVNVETPLGDLVTDAFRWYTGADVALLPSGELGMNLQPGEVTRSHLEECLRKDSTVAVAELTAAQLYDYLDRSGSYIVLEENYSIDWDSSYAEGYLQVSGVQVRYDTAAPAGEKVMSLTLSDGTELARDDTETTLLVASTAEVFSGGYGFPASDYTECTGEIDIVAQYLSQLDLLTVPEDDSRIKLLGTMEFFSGNGRLIGALIGIVGLVLTVTLAQTKKRLSGRSDFLRGEEYDW